MSEKRKWKMRHIHVNVRPSKDITKYNRLYQKKYRDKLAKKGGKK